MPDSFTFACPRCHSLLQALGPDERHCPQDGLSFSRIDGIWRFLLPERAPYFAQFVQEYETVRRAEGRGSHDPAYYRALPFADLSGHMADMWQQRARSFVTLLEEIIRPLEEQPVDQAQSTPSCSLRILDLGAGNGWLSHQLAQRGHCLAAVDLTTNRFDGLGTHVHYEAAFIPIQAEFDHLPLAGEQADLIIFNASFHYTLDYTTTLQEALRLLRSNGQIAVVDTPVYHDGRSGARMVQERQAHFQKAYGFPSKAIPSQNFLTYARLEALAQQLGLRQRLYWPTPPWRWALRRWRARLRRHREPAQFPLIMLQP